MVQESTIAVLTRLSRGSHGLFRGRDAVARGLSRNRLTALCSSGVLVRELPDVYRMAVVDPTVEVRLRAALMWAGADAAAAGRSAGWWWGFEGVRVERPEIVVPRASRSRSPKVLVHQHADLGPLMLRTHRGLRVTGTEATLVALAQVLDDEAFEIACEDARRRRLTSVAALRRYLERHGRRGLAGVSATRALLDELDPAFPSRSTLEVKTRRLLVTNGLTSFEREFPLEWDGRTYRFDFAFRARGAILETNGRRWHDDPSDYEADHEKWSVPARHGWRIVFATWEKVTQRPDSLLAELAAAWAA